MPTNIKETYLSNEGNKYHNYRYINNTQYEK